MTGFWIELTILLLGYGAAALLFWHIPRLPRAQAADIPRVSVIIPARNEEQTLPLLLGDLLVQSVRPLEIIVADDSSSDATANVARACGADVLMLQDKPNDWVGKNWACEQAALAAKGDVLVFLDADVRLAPDGLNRILAAQQAERTVSVQPYHIVERAYEQLALFFNLTQVAANGTALPRPQSLCLFGPVIAISRADYFAAGGHASVKCAVVEDMALAFQLRKSDLPFSVFVGDSGVAFRMYPAGFAALRQGFAKNFATCAGKLPLWLFLLVALMISSVTSAALHLILSLARGESLALLYGALYALWVMFLYFPGRRIGRFSVLTYVFYPLPLVVFLLIFLHSVYLRVFHKTVTWKGRAIKLER